MPNTVTSPANPDYDFGKGFDYSVWPKNSQIDMVNVNWNNDYRDVVDFANQAAIDAYIDSLITSPTISLNRMSYLRQGMPIRINKPFNEAQQYNYLRVKNPLQPVPGEDLIKNYYYFILDTRYVAADTTELVLQLDVWTTYKFQFTFGNCYVERGHIGIANENAFNNYGRDYLTAPEGLDTGSDYVIGWNETAKVIADPRVEPFDYNVLVYSTVDLNSDPGTVQDPNQNTAIGGQFSGIATGAGIYIWKNAGYFQTWLASMTIKSWFTSSIISISLVPNLENYYSIIWNSDLNQPTDLGGNLTNPDNVAYNMRAGWRNYAGIVNGIPTKYQSLKKLFTFPYMLIEMTTWQGTPVILHPEVWRSDDAIINTRLNVIMPSQRLVAFPQNYNANTDSVSYHDYGEYLDLASIINGMPQTLAVNNMQSVYLAANKNQIAFQFTNADWSQQKALRGADASYDIQNQQVQTNKTSTALGNVNLQGQVALQNANNLNKTPLQFQAGVVGGVAGGLPARTAGVVGGAAAGAVGGIASAQMASMDAATATTSGAMQATSNVAQTAIQNRQLQFANDTNYGLANWAARGDYANTIAGINAKIQDTKMMQPTTSGQMGGDTFNMVNGTFEIKLRWKWLDAAHMAMIGDYWLRYGYAINRFMQFPAFSVMSKFTYWKLSETYIIGATIPENFKQTIRGIFEKGVTVWKSPADIGNVDISTNTPLTGFSY